MWAWIGLSYFSLLSLLLTLSGFYGAVGPIPEYIFGELTPQASRSTTGTVATLLNCSSSLFYASTYSILLNAIGPWVQMTYTVPNFFILIYVYRTLPETKGRAVDEIVLGFSGSTPELHPETRF